MLKLTNVFPIFVIAIILFMFGCEQVNSPNHDSGTDIATADGSIAEAHAGSGIVYVDANNNSGNEDGTQVNPFDTMQEGVDHANDNDVVLLQSDFTLSSQVTINKPLTLDGNGNTVDADFYKTSNSNNAAVGIIGTTDVTVLNLKLTASGDKPWPEQLHGVNVYEATNVNLENLDISGFEGTGVVVNSSTVEVSDITTSDNGWHAINVDQRTSESAELTVSGTSSHTETYPPTPHIYIDAISRDVKVNDVEGQYDSEEFDNPEDGSLTARAYFLADDADPEVKDDCKKGGWEDYGFKNQGQCIKFVNTGKDSR